MVSPDEIVGVRFVGIDEHRSALEIFDEIFSGRFFEPQEKALIKPLRFLGIAFVAKENERLAQFLVPRLIDDILAHHHHRRKDNHEEGAKREVADESHGENLFWPMEIGNGLSRRLFAMCAS
jgi:hypothetical protein